MTGNRGKPNDMKNVLLRGKTFFLVRRVPKRYARVETRKQVWISLGTADPNEAARKAGPIWDEQKHGWENLLRGRSDDAEERFAAAREIARTHGFRFMPVEQVAALPVEQIIARVNAAYRGEELSMDVARATLGSVKAPRIRVSRALDLFWDLAADRVLGKSDDQVRRWKNPRIKAVKNFIEVAGDLALDEITPDDMQDFVAWWMERVTAGEVLPSSANKDLTHLSDVLTTVVKKKRLGIDLPVRGWNLREGEKRTRPAFSTPWIVERLLPLDAWDGLNEEARDLFLGMVNTGYRPSEAAILSREQIRLDHEHPHLSIEPVGRTLKTHNARRLIPLFGVSLEAFQRHPDGFPRYRTSADPTAMLNKWMVDRGMRETPEHSVYSLRHSFQDRMVEHGVDDRLRREVFGHALTEERYGKPTIEVLARALKPCAL